MLSVVAVGDAAVATVVGVSVGVLAFDVGEGVPKGVGAGVPEPVAVIVLATVAFPSGESVIVAVKDSFATGVPGKPGVGVFPLRVGSWPTGDGCVNGPVVATVSAGSPDAVVLAIASPG